MIDVLLPFYGDPSLMRAAILSVRAQTTDQWRLVIVDDGYPDADLAPWVAGLYDDRITYHRNERRLGVAGNFNRCLEMSTGSHLVVMGCDDLMEPDYIECLYRALRKHPDAAAVHPDVLVIDGNGEPARWTGDLVKRLLRPLSNGDLVLRGESFAARLLTGVWTYFPAICWDGDFLRRHRFRTDFETVLDMALLLELAIEGRSFVLTDDKTFRYRRHARSASSVSALTSVRFEEERALLREVAGRMDAMGWNRAARSARRHLTSRLHALLLVASVLRGGGARTPTRSLLDHALAPLDARPRPPVEHIQYETAQRWYAERLATRAGGPVEGPPRCPGSLPVDAASARARPNP